MSETTDTTIGAAIRAAAAAAYQQRQAEEARRRAIEDEERRRREAVNEQRRIENLNTWLRDQGLQVTATASTVELGDGFQLVMSFDGSLISLFGPCPNCDALVEAIGVSSLAELIGAMAHFYPLDSHHGMGHCIPRPRSNPPPPQPNHLQTCLHWLDRAIAQENGPECALVAIGYALATIAEAQEARL